MRSDETLNRPPLHKSICRRVRWDFLEDLAQNPSLDFLQLAFRRFDDSNLARAFIDCPVMIVREPTRPKALEIREPLQLTRV